MVVKQKMIHTKTFKTFLFCTLVICLLGVLPVQAQLKKVQLEGSAPTAQKKGSGIALRKAAVGDTIETLPFWDDFSYSTYAGVPDDSLWVNSESVSVTKHIAIRPPSIGVATFDGANAKGNPHSQDPNLSGSMDKLTSKPIKLGQEVVSLAEQQNVFLSFYWQIQGRGERPERGDSLRLFFLDRDSVLHQVWPSSINKANQDADSATFNRVVISLKEEGERLNTDFFHDGFRFQFSSDNRLSGPFDLWHLDYVYLDKKAGGKDRFYAEERALSDYQTSLFKPYTALPIEQFFAAPEKYIDTSFFVTGFNLGDPNPQVGSGENIVLDMDVFANGQHFYQLAKTLSFPQEKLGQLYYEILYDATDTAYFNNGTPILPVEQLEGLKDQDSVYLKTVVRVTDENFKEGSQPYFALNNADTIVNVLHDYFAYDDGTAEYGIAFRGGNGIRLAYEYTLETADTLTHIDMHLPYYAQSINGQYVKLSIWKSLALEETDGEDDLFYSQSISLNNSSALDQFDSYALSNPLVLSAGTYYFGIDKQTDRTITFGFDRNTNSRDKVFISTDLETWHSGLEEEGSLMLRPRFAQGVDPLTLGTKQPELNFPVKIFPNPNNGFFVVESEAHYIQIINIQGQLIHAVEQARGTYRQEIDLSGLQPGLYLVKLQYKDGVINRKILIKN